MSVLAQKITPPAPPVRTRDLPTWRVLLQMSRNVLGVWSERSFEELIIRSKNFGGRPLLVSDPDAARHVLGGGERFSNRASGSSSGFRLSRQVAYAGHASLRSLVASVERGRCTHASDQGVGEPCYGTHLKCSRHCRLQGHGPMLDALATAAAYSGAPFLRPDLPFEEVRTLWARLHQALLRMAALESETERLKVTMTEDPSALAELHRTKAERDALRRELASGDLWDRPA